MTTVLLLRHGEIPQPSPRRFVGQRDLPLTDLGRAQAAAWAPTLARLPISAAWCSSLSRCVDTASLALGGSGLAATQHHGLREIGMGAWEGLTEEEVRQRFPGEHERRGADLGNVAPQGGESFGQMQRRAWEALTGILAQAGGLILVVAHSGVNRALICRVLGVPVAEIFRMDLDYASLNVLHFPDRGRPQLRAMNLPPPGPDTLSGLLANIEPSLAGELR